jgi:hypothetical protein
MHAVEIKSWPQHSANQVRNKQENEILAEKKQSAYA